MRHLGVDFGTKRIGLAMSDAGGTWVDPWGVVAGNAQAVGEVARVCREEGVEVVVVGLPLNMDGTASWMTRAAAGFGRELAGAVAGLGVRVVYVDERLSSFEAEQGLIGRKRAGEKMTRNDKKSRLDALAAAHFLTEYVAGRLQAIEPPG